MPKLLRLPPPPREGDDQENLDEGTNAGQDRVFSLSADDSERTAKFVREFVTTSLIPWMEKSVLEWNENVCISLYAFLLTLLTFCSVYFCASSSLSFIFFDEEVFWIRYFKSCSRTKRIVGYGKNSFGLRIHVWG
jgi:hypothetical protein